MGFIAFAVTSAASPAAVIDTFESGSFDSSWLMTTSATVVTGGGGAGGSNAFARIAGGGAQGASGLAGYINSASEGASLFTLDFDFRYAADTNVRQFAMLVGGITGAGPNTATSNSGGGFINFIYDGSLDVFRVHNGAAFVNVPNVGPAAPGAWHHIQISSSTFGSAAPDYTISINGVSSGPLSHFQSAPGANLAGSFNFNSAFGSNPGFDLDNVAAIVPEPGSLISMMLGGFLLHRRRR